MKTKIGMIATLIVLSASVAMASLYTFNDAGYSYQNQYNWSTSHITDDGNNTGRNSYGGTYPGFQPWFGAIASEEGFGATFTKTSGAGYIGTGGTYGQAGSWGVSSSADGQSSVVLVLKTNSENISNVVLTDNNDDTVTGTYYGLRADFAGMYSPPGSPASFPTYDYTAAWQFDTSSSDLSSYSVGFDVAANVQIQALQLEDASSFAAIPEPATLGFMGLTAGGLFVLRRFGVVA